MATTTEPAAPAEQAPPPPDKRQVLVVQDDGPAAHLFDTAKFEQMQRIAKAMACASLIPEHLRGDRQDIQDVTERRVVEQLETIGNCMLIVNQATRWNLDPFAVAPESYVARGKLGFQGKLVAAVVNTRAGLAGRLSYTFTGQGDGRTVTVSGRFADENEPRTVGLSVKQAKTESCEMWRTDPDQKLVYSGVAKWARRHCPEIMLGVLTDDDLDRMALEVEHHAPGDDLAAKLERHPLEGPPADATPPHADDGKPPASEGQPEDPPVTEGNETEGQLMAEQYRVAIDSEDTGKAVDMLVKQAQEPATAIILGEGGVSSVMAQGKRRKNEIKRRESSE